jgi:hypothetical protein
MFSSQQSRLNWPMDKETAHIASMFSSQQSRLNWPMDKETAHIARSITSRDDARSQLLFLQRSIPGAHRPILVCKNSQIE